MSKTGLSVSTITLTDLIRQYNFSKVSFIKLDIEGGEIDVINNLLDLVSVKPHLIIAIASYHKIKGVESWNHLEKHAKKYPKVMAKTIYPYHATTYLVNESNLKGISILKSLPAYDKIYSKVWPHGEK